jgi:hypothetical protein
MNCTCSITQGFHIHFIAFFFKFYIFLPSLVWAVHIDLWRPKRYSEYAFAVLPLVTTPLWRFTLFETRLFPYNQLSPGRYYSGVVRRPSSVVTFFWHILFFSMVRFFCTTRGGAPRVKKIIWFRPRIDLVLFSISRRICCCSKGYYCK